MWIKLDHYFTIFSDVVLGFGLKKYHGQNQDNTGELESHLGYKDEQKE